MRQLVARAAAAEARARQPLAKQLEAEIRSEGCALSLGDVNGLLQCLWERKEAMEHAQAEASLQLLLQFLHHAQCALFTYPMSSTVTLKVAAHVHAPKHCKRVPGLRRLLIFRCLSCLRRTEKSRKLKELQEELCTLDADIHQARRPPACSRTREATA
jgi:hypothetical protein